MSKKLTNDVGELQRGELVASFDPRTPASIKVIETIVDLPAEELQARRESLDRHICELLLQCYYAERKDETRPSERRGSPRAGEEAGFPLRLDPGEDKR